MTKTKKWELPESEVLWFANGSTINGRKKVTSESREMDTRSFNIKMVHEPTGIEVSGEVPSGNYSKQKMKEAKEKLQTKLWSQLENLVAAHMRLPGR